MRIMTVLCLLVTGTTVWGVPGKTKIYIKDNHGSIRTVIDRESGDVEETMHYYPDGLPMYDKNVVEGASKTSETYSGQEFDDSGQDLGVKGLGLYYYGMRYLDPETGLWLGRDKLEKNNVSVSPYMFAMNNPVMFKDLMGLEGVLVYRREPTDNDCSNDFTASSGGWSLGIDIWDDPIAQTYTTNMRSVGCEPIDGDGSGYQLGNIVTYYDPEVTAYGERLSDMTNTVLDMLMNGHVPSISKGDDGTWEVAYGNNGVVEFSIAFNSFREFNYTLGNYSYLAPRGGALEASPNFGGFSGAEFQRNWDNHQDLHRSARNAGVQMREAGQLGSIGLAGVLSMGDAGRLLMTTGGGLITGKATISTAAGSYVVGFGGSGALGAASGVGLIVVGGELVWLTGDFLLGYTTGK